MQSNNNSIQNLYNFCSTNCYNIKDYNVYYNEILHYTEAIIFQELNKNCIIENYDKNILTNITYENLIIKKVKNKLANYQSLSNCDENVHISFLNELLKVLVKSYVIYNYNNINYKRILLEMIYLIFLNKKNDKKTPLLNLKIIDYLISQNKIVKNVFLEGIDCSYKDISYLSITFVKAYKQVIFSENQQNLIDIIKNNYMSISSKEKLIQVFNSENETAYFQEYFLLKITNLVNNMNIKNEEANFKIINENLILLKKFIPSHQQDATGLFEIMNKVISVIKLYITGDPNIDLTNEYKIIISYKIYSNIIDIFNQNLSMVSVDYIHELLLTLSNSACIHITVPLYKTLLKPTNDGQKIKYLNNLNIVLKEYHHYGRRFGAIPYMYQQIFSTLDKTLLVGQEYQNFEYTALNFEIKLAILPYLNNFKDELIWVFKYKPQRDYVMDTYIVRLITGIINFTLTKLKSKNYKVFKECVSSIVSWINSDDSYDKMLLGVLAQLVKNKSFVSRLNINWKRLSHHSNWLIRKTAAELFYICNTRNFDLIAYISNIFKQGQNDDNSLQYHLFVLNCYYEDKTANNIDVTSLVKFYEEFLVICNNKYLRLQVFKNINDSDLLRIAFNQRQNYFKDVEIINQKSCGVNELTVRELLAIYNDKLLMKVLKSTEYYELALDYMLIKDLSVPFDDLFNQLLKIYEVEKYEFIKLKIVKVVEILTKFDISCIQKLHSLDDEVHNHDLRQEFEVLDLNNYWNYFSDEDETKRLISLKKAIVSKNQLKMYQFENDTDSVLITNLYNSLNLPLLSSIVNTLDHEKVNKELAEILEILLKELQEDYFEMDKKCSSKNTLFEVDNFHNISNLWWYIYLLTKGGNVINYNFSSEVLKLLKTAELKSSSANKIDIRLLAVSRIIGYKDFTNSYYIATMDHL